MSDDTLSPLTKEEEACRALLRVYHDSAGKSPLRGSKDRELEAYREIIEIYLLDEEE